MFWKCSERLEAGPPKAMEILHPKYFHLARQRKQSAPPLTSSTQGLWKASNQKQGLSMPQPQRQGPMSHGLEKVS